MGSIAWQGGQLLHGLWSHAERAILRGRPPPGGGSGNASRGVRESLRTQTIRHIKHDGGSKHVGHNAPAHGQTQHVTDSLVQSMRVFAEEALTAVFKSTKVKVEPEAAGAVRGMLRSTRGAASGRGFTMGGGRCFVRPTHLPLMPLAGRTTNQVGLGLARNFSSGMGFEYFVTNAPLAARLVADQLLDDDVRKSAMRGNHVNGKMATARRTLTTSARRSGRAVHAARMQEVARAYGLKAAMLTATPAQQSQLSMASMPSSSSSSSSSNVASSVAVKQQAPAVVVDDEESEMSMSEEYDYFFPPTPPPVEPIMVTQLVIPLCPDLNTIMSVRADHDDDVVRNFRDDRPMAVFLRDCYDVAEAYDRHRLKRILAIEHAFDQQPLRAYRPASWHDDMLVGFLQDDDDDDDRAAALTDVSLTVPFPHCNAAQVTDMLRQTLSPESTAWFARFLVETVRMPSSSTAATAQDGESEDDDDDDDEYLLTGPPTATPPSSDDGMSDLGRDVDEMGAASLVSMADYDYHSAGFPSSIALARSEAGHSLRFPTL